MNQYKNSLDYYNYVSNNYNQPIYAENTNPLELYDPYQGFIRGNMFPNLYNDYKLSSPILLNNDFKTYFDAVAFAAHDINLYLDVYPDDKDMIVAFNNYSNEWKRLLEEYQRINGSIFINSDENNGYPWAWNKEPWPWEN